MAEHVFETQIIATGVTFDEYMEKYASEFTEFAEGVVIKMHPVGLPHIEISSYLLILLKVYFKLKPIGKVIPAPFSLRLMTTDSLREPDLQIILKGNPGKLHKTYMEGAADICIEIVSPESVARDYGEKLQEYEKGGVGEYWIIDYVRKDALFYRLSDESHYARHSEDASGSYITPRLPQFRLHVPTLWEEDLPDPIAITEAVKEMLS